MKKRIKKQPKIYWGVIKWNYHKKGMKKEKNKWSLKDKKLLSELMDVTAQLKLLKKEIKCPSGQHIRLDGKKPKCNCYKKVAKIKRVKEI